MATHASRFSLLGFHCKVSHFGLCHGIDDAVGHRSGNGGGHLPNGRFQLSLEGEAPGFVDGSSRELLLILHEKMVPDSWLPSIFKVTLPSIFPIGVEITTNIRCM